MNCMRNEIVEINENKKKDFKKKFFFILKLNLKFKINAIDNPDKKLMILINVL